MPYANLEKRREHSREYMQKYREQNREKLNLRERERRKNDPEFAEKRRKNCRTWLSNNKEYRKEVKKNWNDKNPDRVLATKRKTKHGISLEEQLKLLENQNYKCKICEIEITFFSHLDHCHTTGKIRNFLCTNCNSILGHSKDRIKVLKSAIEYLEIHNA